MESYEAIVVGSGFGGSVVADRLTREGWSVCVLERGLPHPPGSFPRTPSEIKTSFWDPAEKLYGMFDVWSFSGLAALVASGLGGGSLIYANVLEKPVESWLTVEDPSDGSRRKWPVTLEALAPHYDAVHGVLAPQPYPDAEPYGSTPKTVAFRAAAKRAGLTEKSPDLAIRFADDAGVLGRRRPFGKPEDNRHGVQRMTCELLGECDIGCNLGAKQTLDLTYLSGTEAEIKTGAEVRTLRPTATGFEVGYLQHHPDTGEHAATQVVACRKLVLAAGTFGTALLLLRNRLALPGLSRRVGHWFCANGDYLAFAADCGDGSDNGRVDAWRGPVITSSARARDDREGGDGPGFHLQDGGFPGWAGWVTQVGGLRRNRMRAGLIARQIVEGRLRGDPGENLGAEMSRLLGDDGARLLPILSLGRDIPSGRLRLRDKRLDVAWRKDESAALYERSQAAARRLTKELGGRYVDPLRIFRPITVHPLGGCAMSEDKTNGVVDTFGCVHGVENLSVADGSALPGPVGINPAFTIAALAHRHAERLIEVGK